MPHSEEEAEQQERQDIQGSSGHAHTLTWLSPGVIYQSGEIDRSGNISKCGDKLMRHALYEAANSHLRIAKKWSVLRAWGIKLAKRVGRRKDAWQKAGYYHAPYVGDRYRISLRPAIGFERDLRIVPA
jgi:hypothetical protein